MAEATNYVLKSYRYLRLVMIGMVVLLAISVLIEMQQTGFGCWRTSISSYFWTPVRGVFVGALVSVGVCLIVLRGNTDREDILLNLAGGLAPIVAFVPILDPRECQSTPWSAEAVRGADIFNNVGSLLLVALIAIALAWWVARRDGVGGHLSRNDLLGIILTLLLVFVGVALFFGARAFFDRWAHYLAAIPLFLVLLLVMVLNARSYARARAADDGRYAVRRADLANRYLLIAVVTVVVVGALGLVTWLGSWAHGTFWLEVAVIVAFAVFWTVQTVELWDEPTGVRPDPAGTPS